VETIAPGFSGRISLTTIGEATDRGRVGADTIMNAYSCSVSLVCINDADRRGIPDRLTGVATGTPATALLTRLDVPFTLHPYEHDPRSQAYGEEAAQALGVDPARIFKTLIASVETKLACAVVPVAARLDLKAFAAALGAKRAELAEPAAAARATGYVVGGISPIGQKSRLRVVLDESAEAFETVYVSAGKRGLQVQLAPADLVRASAALVASIATS
jgi:Cys-tRNA(Pro)/Cys-tRNA(Cys) deacylase